MRKNFSLSPKLRTHKRVVTDPRSVFQVGRNDPCPCGSGKKYKDCHEAFGEGYLRKLARRRHQDELKQKGVPWWKRMLLFYR
jgi:hypothetical protein